MRQAILTTTDASGAATVSSIYVCDIHRNPFNIGLGVVKTGTVNYTVQHTFDDPQAAGFDPTTATWFSHATLAAQTGNLDGNYQFPVRGIRIKQNSGSGSCILNVIQAGLR